MSYTGVYINLDCSTERRAAMEEQLSRLRLEGRYRRLPAAEGNTLEIPTKLSDGEIGCLISHYLACKQHAGSDKHLHVVEDDVLFSGISEGTIRSVAMSKLFDDYDILFLDHVFSPFNKNGLQFLRVARRVYENSITRNASGVAVKVKLTPEHYFAGSTSYLVNHRSITKLLDFYERAFAAGIKNPVDIMIRDRGKECGLRVACLFPFVTSVRPDAWHTTITGRKDNALVSLATIALRHSFFVDRDIEALLKMAREFLPSTNTDPHHLLLAHLMDFYLNVEFIRSKVI